MVIQAVLTFAFYWLAWVPGAVANWVFLAQADRLQRETGTKPAGKTALALMFWLFLALPAGLALAAVLVLAGLLVLPS